MTLAWLFGQRFHGIRPQRSEGAAGRRRYRPPLGASMRRRSGNTLPSRIGGGVRGDPAQRNRMAMGTDRTAEESDQPRSSGTITAGTFQPVPITTTRRGLMASAVPPPL